VLEHDAESETAMLGVDPRREAGPVKASARLRLVLWFLLYRAKIALTGILLKLVARQVHIYIFKDPCCEFLM